MSALRRRLPRLQHPYSTRTILPHPSWSVRTLLPSSDTSSTKSTPTISPSTLAHLLRLSALPPPADPASLHDHLHFVRYLTKVKTLGVVPIAAIRDEVHLAGEYSYEDVMGTEEQLDDAGVSDGGDVSWNAVDRAKRKVGSFFVVDEAVEDELVRPEVEK